MMQAPLPTVPMAFTPDPYPEYHRLRQAGPVQFVASAGSWLVTGHAAATAILKDLRFGKANPALRGDAAAQLPEPVQHLFGTIQHWMLAQDPPEHTRLRSLSGTAFTPKVIEGLRPHIREIAERLLDEAAGKGHMDLIAEFAYPLPVTVIAELLGVPVEDRDKFRAWSSAVAGTADAAESLEKFLNAGAGMQQISAYLREIIAQRRQEPRHDLLSAMIAARDEGRQFSEDELVATAVLLLVAGHETTVNLIGNGTLALLTHPEEQRRLLEQPDLIQPAVEELLRFDSPVQAVRRVAREDVTMGEQTIRAGQPLSVMLGAANRDPAVFAEPDRLDIARTPNPHLAFSSGIHFCLGAPLARLEGQIALATLCRRFPNLALATDHLDRRKSVVFRSLNALPVSF
jgi:cytochrome P450